MDKFITKIVDTTSSDITATVEMLDKKGYDLISSSSFQSYNTILRTVLIFKLRC